MFFVAPNVSAQDNVAYYTVDSSAGVWVQADGSPVEAVPEAITYEQDASAVPEYDLATASQQYQPPIEMESEAYDDDTRDSRSEAPAEQYRVVKNKDFFGVDKDKCCDEWSKFCKFKDMRFGCDCGGLKANRGHLGISWLRSADEGEDCDYCQGGCCKKGKAACRIRQETRKSAFSSAFDKSSRDDCDASTCSKEEGCTTCR